MKVKQRFYDKEPTVCRVVDMIFRMPESLQEIVALGMVQIANRECKANELMNNVKTLGSDNVLALFKSKQKRRIYDNNQIIHGAVNHLFILSPHNQRFVSEKVLELVGFVQELLVLHEVKSPSPNPEALRAVTQLVEVYVQSGREEAQVFLDVMKEKFMGSLARMEILSEGGDQGLRVRQVRPWTDGPAE